MKLIKYNHHEHDNYFNEPYALYSFNKIILFRVPDPEVVHADVVHLIVFVLLCFFLFLGGLIETRNYEQKFNTNKIKVL